MLKGILTQPQDPKISGNKAVNLCVLCIYACSKHILHCIPWCAYARLENESLQQLFTDIIVQL